MSTLSKPGCLSIIAVFAAAAGCLASPVPGDTPAAATIAPAPKEIAATVNGTPIYEDQLKTEVEQGLASYRRYGMRKDNPELLRQLRETALDKLIGDQLVIQESEKLTVENLEEKIEQQLASFEEKRGGKKGLENYMKQRALTMERLRESARIRVYVDQYLKERGIAEPEIAEERIRQMYDSSPDNFAREESVRVSHILVAVDPHATLEAKEQARQEAAQIHREILEGKDFAEMAKKHSDCNSASGGGDLRFITKGFMPKEFDQVAFTIAPGTVSEIVETKYGYHILKVSTKVPAGVAPYEEVRDFIKKYLQMDEYKIKLASHIDELKAKSQIKIVPK